MPAMVGIVARDTPPAIDRASPPPVTAMTWNTTAIPVSVPMNPSNGHNDTHTLINDRFCSIFSRVRETSARRICLAFQDARSARCSQALTTTITSPGSTKRKYQIRSNTSVHMKNVSPPIP